MIDAPVIFEQSIGLTRETSHLLAGGNGVAYFLSSLVPIWLIDRVGRVSPNLSGLRMRLCDRGSSCFLPQSVNVAVWPF
jgi:hypothetical protein